MKRSAIAVALCLSAAAFGVQAQMKPEDQVKQRRAGMAIIGYNFASLGAMAQDKKPYNKDEATRNADWWWRSHVSKNFFGGGWDEVGDTALPGCGKRAEFDEDEEDERRGGKEAAAIARTDLPP